MNSGWLQVGAAAATSALLLFAAQPDSPGGMVLSVLAPLPLFVVGLWWGLFHGAATGAAATIAILFGVSLEAGLYYAAVNAVPTALLMWQAEREPGKPVRLVLTLAACAAVPIVAAALYFSGHDGGLEGVIKERLSPLLNAAVTDRSGVTPPQWASFIETIAGLFPALASTFWALLIAVNGALAQGLLRRFGKNRLPTPDVAAILAPRWMLAVFGVTVALSMMSGGVGYLADNLLPVAALPFFLGGLALAHWVLRRSGAPGLWLGLLYGLLIVFGWPAVILMLIGLIDTIFDFRGRAGPPSAPPAT